MEMTTREEVECSSGESICLQLEKTTRKIYGSIPPYFLVAMNVTDQEFKFKAPHIEVNTPHQCVHSIWSLKFYYYFLDRLVGVLCVELIQDLYLYFPCIQMRVTTALLEFPVCWFTQKNNSDDNLCVGLSPSRSLFLPLTLFFLRKANLVFAGGFQHIDLIIFSY